MNTVAFI